MNKKPNQYEIDKKNGYKKCAKCKKKLSLDNFYMDKRCFTTDCKECRKKRVKKYVNNNREKVKKYHREYGQRDYVKAKEKYLRDHRTKKQIKIDNNKKKIYYLKNKKRINKTNRDNYYKNHEYYRKLNNEYNKTYTKLPEVRLRREKIRKKRTITDINFRLKAGLRRRLKLALKTQNCKKTTKTMDIIGCDIIFFKQYIESQFVKGMTWENQGNKDGQWCIDHYYPCEVFDLEDIRQQKVAFHYTNCRPLWYSDNCKKNDILPNDGRRAWYLTKEEKLDYLTKNGFDFQPTPTKS